jgi:CHAP domain/Putative peptidoglycan binding domain
MEYPNRIIKKGESNKDIVKAVQTQLLKRGITSVAVTGEFGAETVSAVMLFQSLNRDRHNRPLEADGEIGPLSWESLFEIPFKPNATAESDLLREALSVAQSQVGVMEQPKGSNLGPEIEMYQKRVGIPRKTFWCAAYVYFCFDEAAKKLGLPNPVFKTGGCLHHWNNSPAKKIKAKDAQNNPSLVKPGHIFILDHGHGHGHTGIVKRVEGGRLITLEGNSNPSGSSNGIGVFELDIRKVFTPNLKGYLDYSL